MNPYHCRNRNRSRINILLKTIKMIYLTFSLQEPKELTQSVIEQFWILSQGWQKESVVFIP